MPAEEPRRFLVAVGVESYDDPAWGRLQQVADELTRIVHLLTSPSFRLTRILEEESADPRTPDFAKTLHTWAVAPERSPDDHLVLYWSGHGSIEDDRLILTLPETRYDATSTTGLAAELLVGALVGQRSKLGPVLLILDVCYAGQAGIDIGARLGGLTRARHRDRPPEIAIFCAARSREEAAQGTFVDAFVKAVRLCEERAERRPPYLVLQEIFDETVSAMESHGQHPRLHVVTGGDLAFFRNPKHIPYLPPELGRRTGIKQLTSSKPLKLGGIDQDAAVTPDNVSKLHRFGEIYGRGELLKELHESCHRTTGRSAPVTVLTGQGGMGKTTMAIHYAVSAQEQEEYCALLFVSANTPQTLREEFAGLADVIGVEHDTTDFDDRRAAVIRWMKSHPTWLLILDNVDTREAADGALDLARECRNGHILVTACFTDWPAVIETHQIPELDRDSAVKFLLKEANHRSESVADSDDARDLADDLGQCPDLLEYAAGRIRRAKMSFAEFRSLWARNRTPFLKHNERTGFGREARRVTTWLSTVDGLTESAFELLQMLSWLSPTKIPRRLMLSDSLYHSLTELADYSLVTLIRNQETREFDAFIINSALQDITRTAIKWKDALKGTPAERLTRGADRQLVAVAELIEKAFQTDEKGLMPHVLSVLYYLHEQDIEKLELFETMGTLVVLALRSVSLQNTKIEHLIAALSDFYEVEPLSSTLNFLAGNKKIWVKVQGQLLDANNYVLRYAMAKALADARAWSNDEIAVLLDEGRSLNEFELGGYALALRYARDPKMIDPGSLQQLADRNAYSGRSILGDLFLNLVFRSDEVQPHALRGLVNERFWTPIWEFVRLDVEAIEAAQDFMGRVARSKVESGALPEFDRLTRIDQSLKDEVALLTRSDGTKALPEMQALLKDYFSLGHNETLRIRNAEEEFRGLEKDRLQGLIRLFFAHPVWAVAEAAANVLSSAAADAHREGNSKRCIDLLQIIENLLHDKDDWHVRYGAYEAAYQVRNVDPKFFYSSVAGCGKSENCKIQGLCAENLVSHMLNSARDRRNETYRNFKYKIQFWIDHDDAWVLEHIYRLFRRLHISNKPLIDFDGKAVDPVMLARNAPLLSGEKWQEMERDKFLQFIEERKRALVSP